MRLTGQAKNPDEFFHLMKSPESIHQFYQESLGPPLEGANQSGSLLAERVLFHLQRFVPNLLYSLRPKYFVPGMPANVALLSLVTSIRHSRHLPLDLMAICSDVPEAISMNRVLAIALNVNALFDVFDNHGWAGEAPVETLGLFEVTRRNLSLIQSTGLSIAPIDSLHKSFSEHIYEILCEYGAA